MFGQKKVIEPPSQDIAVSVIPPEFYGGNNPVITFHKTNIEVGVPSGNDQSQKISAPVSAAKAAIKQPSTVLGNRKVLLVSAGGLFVLFVGFASLYYWYQATHQTTTKNTTISQVPPPTQDTVPAQTATTTLSDTESTTTIVVASSTPVTSTPPTSLVFTDGPLDFPSTLLGNSNDSDSDGLTNEEEELLKTNPGVPDTDKDGYDDYTEIENLYSPITAAPAKLIDTSLVSEFVNPTYGYKMYYPANWAHDPVDPEYRDMLFSTLSGENVEVRVITNTSTDFADWFGVWAPGERYNDLVKFTTRFGYSGFMRNDKLVYYFPAPGKVYVMLYHPEQNPALHYRSVFSMMARSFRPAGTSEVAVPEQSEDNPANASSTPSLDHGI